MEQLSIFDWLGADYPDISTIPEEEAVRIIGEQLGIVFKYNDWLEQWEGKKGGLVLDLHYSHFNLPEDKSLFLSAGYTNKREISGGGSPCRSIEGAINYFKKALRKGR